jgi:hypothetical protein
MAFAQQLRHNKTPNKACGACEQNRAASAVAVIVCSRQGCGGCKLWRERNLSRWDLLVAVRLGQRSALTGQVALHFPDAPGAVRQLQQDLIPRHACRIRNASCVQRFPFLLYVHIEFTCPEPVLVNSIFDGF